MEYLFVLDYSTGGVHRYSLLDGTDPQRLLEEEHERGNIGKISDLQYMITTERNVSNRPGRWDNKAYREAKKEGWRLQHTHGFYSVENLDKTRSYAKTWKIFKKGNKPHHIKAKILLKEQQERLQKSNMNVYKVTTVGSRGGARRTDTVLASSPSHAEYKATTLYKQKRIIVCVDDNNI